MNRKISKRIIIKPPSGYYDSDDEPWQIGDNNPIHYDQEYLD